MFLSKLEAEYSTNTKRCILSKGTPSCMHLFSWGPCSFSENDGKHIRNAILKHNMGISQNRGTPSSHPFAIGIFHGISGCIQR